MFSFSETFNSHCFRRSIGKFSWQFYICKIVVLLIPTTDLVSLSKMTIIPSSIIGVSGHFSIKRATPCSILFTMICLLNSFLKNWWQNLVTDCYAGHNIQSVACQFSQTSKWGDPLYWYITRSFKTAVWNTLYQIYLFSGCKNQQHSQPWKKMAELLDPVRINA